MKLVILFIMILSCKTVKQDVSETKNAEDSAFYKESHKLKLLSELQGDLTQQNQIISNSVFSIDFPNMNCTGTYVSNQGHILTAEHCINGCFKLPSGNGIEYFQWQTFEDKNSPSPFIPNYPEDLAIKTLNYKNFTEKEICEVLINNRKRQVQLIFAGKGQLFPRFKNELKSQKLKEKYIELLKNGYFAASDFVILKVLNQDAPTPCVKLSRKAPESEEFLKTISYTCGHGGGNNGDLPLYADGYEVNEYLLQHPSVAESIKKEVVPGSFMTTIFADSCSSGSPIFNKQNEIVGVASTVYDGKWGWGEYPQLTRAAAISSLLDQMSEELLTQEILCQ